MYMTASSPATSAFRSARAPFAVGGSTMTPQR
jgi:hypothetical protein